jgi:lipopolysaccharide biosynthesis glycosyltransferase
MTDNQPIVIAVACDNHYMPLLAALMKSIEVNHKTGEQILFYVLDDGISGKNKRKLVSSVDKEMFSIEWVSGKSVIPGRMTIPYDNSSYPLIIYMRMFIPYFVPEKYGKVIYMDVDMIVLGDISDLWNTDLKGYPVGAAIDVRIKEFGSRTAIANYRELGFEAGTRYFNTGLIIMNTRQWRDQDITPKVFGCIEANRPYANYPDQYGLNVVLANNWMEIDTMWSWSAEEWNPDARLIHFIWRKPIYKTYMFEKRYQEMFFYYLDLTMWKGFVPVNEFRRLSKKVLNKIFKLPLLLKKQDH